MATFVLSDWVLPRGSADAERLQPDTTVVISDSWLSLRGVGSGKYPRREFAHILAEHGLEHPLLLFKGGLRAVDILCYMRQLLERVAERSFHSLVVCYNLTDLCRGADTMSVPLWWAPFVTKLMHYGKRIAKRVLWVTSEPQAFPKYV